MGGFDVSSTVELNFPALKSLEANAVKALEMTADALLTEVKNAEVMPFDTGNLQNESTHAELIDPQRGVAVIACGGEAVMASTTPYARRLYYHPEYNFNREHNIAAGGEWFKPWLPGGTKSGDAAKIYAKIFKKVNGL